MQICSVAEHATSEAFRESPKRLERIQGDVLAMLKAVVMPLAWTGCRLGEKHGGTDQRLRH
jgi:hypothetical protein